MKMFKKVLSAITASAVTMTMAAGGAAMFSTSAADMTAIELVDDMGNGWNLGNTFDCWGNITWTDQTWTAWGNKDEYLTQALFTSIKNSGFDSVRIPITWSAWTDSSTYDIDDSYLAKIKTMVDYCYANDMYVIINMHWDWVSDGSQWLNKGSGAKDQFLTMWKEIANYFKDYDNKLVFEDMNEVTFDYNTLNDFNASFVDTVRATGGNNADRLLLLAGSNTNQEQTCNSQFVVPDDDMVAVSIHYYTPATWCVAEPGASWGYKSTWDINSEAKAVYDDFNEMANYFVTQGVPVIIGEYGVLNYYNNAKLTDKSASDIADYLKTVASAGLQTEGIATFLWDDSTGQHQCFDRATLSWYDKEVQQVYADLAAEGADVPEGMILTDRVQYNTSDLEAQTDENGNLFYTLDLNPYRDLATVSTVVLEGVSTSANNATSYNIGGGIAFNSLQNGATEVGDLTFTSENWALPKDTTSCIVELDGQLTDDDGNVTTTYEMDMDYLNVCVWWTYSNATGDTISLDLDTITLIFDQKIYVDAETGVVIPSDTTEPTETTTEPQPTETETTEPEPTETEPTEPTTPSETDPTTPSETEPTTPSEGGTTKYGDVNVDGEVNVLDVITLNKNLLGGGELDPQGIINADVDLDNVPTAADSLNILKSIIGLVKTLPVK